MATTSINKQIGNTGSDELSGTTGRDFLWGGAGNDLLEGGDGNDVLDGGTGGRDRLSGGNGNDTLIDFDGMWGEGGRGDDVLIGRGHLFGGVGNDTIIMTGHSHVFGDAGADILINTSEDDGRIRWRGDGDENKGVTVDLEAGRGWGADAEGDVISGFHAVVGSNFDDILFGTDQWDLFRSKGGADIFNGRGGNDLASYEASDGGVTVDLGGPKVRVTVDLGGRTEIGDYSVGVGGHAQGDKHLNVENLSGSSHDDTFRGDEKANQMDGGGGDDVLEGRGGADTLNGGSGSDTASYESSSGSESGEGVTVNLGGPQDDNGYVSGHTGGHAAGDKLKGIENLRGGAHADTLTGDGNANVLEGGAGRDTLDGGGGSDTASYAHSAGGVAVDLTRLGGVQASTNNHAATGDTLRSIENLRGGAHADTLTGDGNANVLEGGAGADTLNGGGGSDTASYAHSAGSVAVDLTRPGGVQASTNTRDAARNNHDAAGDTLTGIENLRGSAHADTLTGDGNANVLEGGAGEDRLYGGGGDDTLEGGGGYDDLYGNAGADHLVGGGGEDVLRGGTENDELEGGAEYDFLYGEGGADTLTGGTGADTLNGGGGADTFVFGAESVVNTGSSTETRTLEQETDVVEDFSGLGADGVKQAREDGDQLDLSGLTEDLEVKPTLTFLATQGAGFTGVKGQVRYVQEDEAGTDNDVTYVQVDLDGATDAEGNYDAEFQVTLDGLHSLSAADLILA